MKHGKQIISGIIVSMIFCFSMEMSAQDAPANTFTQSKEVLKRKGTFFFTWGYNLSAYSKSDIHFWGNGYDFVLTDVRATDAPTKDFATYVKPSAFTVPQYNYRLGYYLTDRVFISVGSDHMKYAIEKQSSRLSGKISTGDNQGTYSHTEVVIGEGRLNGHFGLGGNMTGQSGLYKRSVVSPGQVLHSGGSHDNSILDSLPGGFLSGFEHCDGLNDVSVEIGLNEQLWLSKNFKHSFFAFGACGVGMVIPDTEAYVLGEEAYHNQEGPSYHLAGFSTSAILGFQFEFFRHFFLQTRLKGGYINLPNIKTTVSGGKASQHFYFLETICSFGFSYKFGKK